MTSDLSDTRDSTWREPLKMPWTVRAACWALDGLSKLGTGIQSFEIDELMKAASGVLVTGSRTNVHPDLYDEDPSGEQSMPFGARAKPRANSTGR